jgi:S-DNA-T family DNA segregation ATPase FtsK/SpoIIIE
LKLTDAPISSGSIWPLRQKRKLRDWPLAVLWQWANCLILQLMARAVTSLPHRFFTPENIGAWVGLVVTQSLAHEQVVDSMESLRLAIRAHWHRGALSLWSDWTASNENYDKFIETLVERRSDMPEVSNRKSTTVRDDEDIGGSKAAEDASATLIKALDELGIKVQVKEAIHGPRITRYRVLLMNLADAAKLKRSMSQLGLAMNLGEALPTVANGDEAKNRLH